MNHTSLVVSVDNENPVIAGCPTDQSFDTDAGVATATVSWTEPTAEDNSGTQSLTSTHLPGATFSIGTTAVTYTSEDDAGNTDTCTFNVIITGVFI